MKSFKEARGTANSVKEYGGPKISRADYLKKGREYHARKVNEADKPGDEYEYDYEGDMAKTQLRGVVKDAEHMIKMFEDDENLPEWVQSKITKAADYLKSAHNYMMNKDDEEEDDEDEMMDEGTDVEEMSTLTKMKAKLARGLRGPSKKATPTMFRQTGAAARRQRQRAQNTKTYELGRKAREK